MNKNRTLEEIQEDFRTLTRVPSEFIYAKLDKLTEEIIELPKSKWIPCSERLPEESNYYLACMYNIVTDDYDCRKAWFTHENDCDINESIWHDDLTLFEKVIAWMPLSELYEENSN